MSEEPKGEIRKIHPGSENLIPAKPGEIRNPLGRRTAGASIKEWINVLAEKDLTEDDLRKIARDKSVGWTKRTAAERLLRTLEAPDLADFEPLLDGTSSMREMRNGGHNTAVLKKVKVKTRRIPDGDNEPTIEVEREIELFDRSGEEFDRVMDRTDGKPSQVVAGSDGGPVQHILKVRFDDRT